MHRFTVTTQATIASAVFSLLDTEHALKGNGALSNQTVRLLFQQLGNRFHPDRVVTAMKQRGYPVSIQFSSGQHNTNRIFHQEDSGHILKKTRLISIKKKLIKQAPKYWIHTVYTGMPPHTHTNFSRPVDNSFLN